MDNFSVGKHVKVVDVKLIGQITNNIVVNFNGMEVVFDKEELQIY